jgi:hypothetical protein
VPGEERAAKGWLRLDVGLETSTDRKVVCIRRCHLSTVVTIHMFVGLPCVTVCRRLECHVIVLTEGQTPAETKQCVSGATTEHADNAKDRRRRREKTTHRLNAVVIRYIPTCLVPGRRKAFRELIIALTLCQIE